MVRRCRRHCHLPNVSLIPRLPSIDLPLPWTMPRYGRLEWVILVGLLSITSTPDAIVPPDREGEIPYSRPHPLVPSFVEEYRVPSHCPPNYYSFDCLDTHGPPRRKQTVAVVAVVVVVVDAVVVFVAVAVAVAVVVAVSYCRKSLNVS